MSYEAEHVSLHETGWHGSRQPKGFSTTAAQNLISPKSLPGLWAWWDVRTLGRLALGTDFSTWNDISGNGNDLTDQSSGAHSFTDEDPQGRPLTKWNGSAAGTSGMDTSAMPPTPFTVWVVHRPMNDGKERAMCGWGGVTDGRFSVTGYDTVLKQGADMRLNNHAPQGRWEVATCIMYNDGSNSHIYDGVERAASAGIGQNALSNFRVGDSSGGGHAYSGYIREIIVAGDPGHTVIEGVIRYLYAKWDLGGPMHRVAGNF